MQDDYARRCGTTVSYLRKAASIGQRLGEGLCISLDRESCGQVSCESLRPDVDWAYLRAGRPVAVHCINGELTKVGPAPQLKAPNTHQETPHA
ncbi:helix-turn-helix domain-containing protein [Kerstersia gyiorum]|nr:YdaS family helix-turn-helix protein [Kerstersia gyiorum]MCR4158802.1 helix-turn-helix domain-containing protein [Kerstersia gyiorum]